ncbi:hypothetical protein XENOCAPTIV_001088 [Xenoophorus captivus]|uniref:Uncharacterized protein n=1 Tax=Xenoophorus captivus TaxID=1517983 RepID=A0ABV0Q7B0_9TELE
MHVSKLVEKDFPVRSAVEFIVNGRMRDAHDQFIEGFKTLGLLKELQKNPTVFLDIFVCQEKPLTARDLSSLFTVAYFDQGSNRRALLNQLVCFWRDWLIDIEGLLFALQSIFKNYFVQYNTTDGFFPCLTVAFFHCYFLLKRMIVHSLKDVLVFTS